jgi:cyclopropane fatty-acyl-phospholipid synthase-like methyltransferase
MNNKLPKHLGGHANRTHIDEKTLDHLIDKFNIKSMCDIGCGPGGMVRLAKNKGLNVLGIDGDFTLRFPLDLNIIIHDFITGPLLVEEYDLGWSCEFLEHVKEDYQANYFSVFTRCRIVCCTFATSKKGHHHVNVKNQEYWDEVFNNYGFVKDIDSTQHIRENSGMIREFIRNTGSVYRNTTL